eukprot:1091912_1
MSTSVVAKLLAVSTGVFSSALATLHWKFGIKLRSNFGPNKRKKIENTVCANDSGTLPTTFSICSHNIWCSFVYGGPKRKKRLQLLVDNIAKDQPDVICLQEMFVFSLGPFVICGDFDYLHHQLVHSLGYTHYSNPTQSLPSLFGGNNGLMIYSKHRLHSCDSYAFDTNIRRHFSAKGWLSASIKLSESNDQKINIINTHLEHANRDYILGQLNVLKHQVNNTDTFNVCLGDFNICSNHTFQENYSTSHRLYDILSNVMTERGLPYDLFNNEERTFRITKEEPSASYDHMFVNQELKNKIVSTHLLDYHDTNLVASDHYGLLVHIDQSKS